MALIGRSDERTRLDALAASHKHIVIVGIPGSGRRALAAAFVEQSPHWTLQEAVFAQAAQPTQATNTKSKAANTIRISTALPATGVGVLRLAPLGEEHALEFLVTHLRTLGADLGAGEATLRAEVRPLLHHADGLPRALEVLARLIIADGVTGALKRLSHTSLLRVMAHDEEGLRWRDELLSAVRDLPESARTALNLLSRLVTSYDDVRGLLGNEFGAEVILLERGFVVPANHGKRVLRCVASLATHEGPLEPKSRFVRWVFQQARDPAARLSVSGELAALFNHEATANESVRTARTAGALLVPLVLDRGPIRPHLDRLIGLDRRVGEADIETECAIAQLRLVVGEPEAMWRRLEPVLDIAGPLQGRAQHLAGSCQRRLGHQTSARAHYTKAVSCFEVADPQRELGMVLSNLGGLEVESGDAAAARKAWSRALRLFAASDDPRAEAIVLGDLGLLDHESGEYEQAARRYKRALSLHEEVGNVRFAGIVSCDLGELALLRGSPKEASAHLRRASEQLRSAEDSRQVGLCEAALALAEAACGDAENARRRLDGVRDHAPEDLWPVMELYDAAIGIHEAALARRSGDAKGEATLIARAHSALAKGISTPDEARRVAQTVRAELRRYEQRAGWAIAHDAGFFVTPDDTRVDLSRRHVSRRLLQALLDHRLAHPGEVLLLEDLLRLGWPGQRVLEASGRNRLHVALSGLRKLGVDTLLLRQGAGYLLDPEVELTVVR